MLLIRLSIETTEPLSGTAAIEGGDPLPFKGWLDLLSVITELARPRPSHRTTEGHLPVKSERRRE
jgi:hypothetical protein